MDNEEVRESLTPIYQKETVIKYNGLDLSQVRYFYTRYNYNKSNRPTKQVLYAYLCTGKCYKDNSKYRCKLSDSDQYCSKSTIESCPYHLMTLELTEPRTNNYLYDSYLTLISKLECRQIFGKYTEWVLENADVKQITDEEFNQLINIPEFRLEYITNSKYSYQDFIDKIIADREYNWNLEFYTSIRCKVEVPPVIMALIYKYRQKLATVADGRKMLPFLDEKEIQYDHFKTENPNFIVHIGDYYLCSEYCFKMLWQIAKKENNYLCDKRFDLMLQDNEVRDYDFYFSEEQVEDVIRWAKKEVYGYGSYWKEYKYLIELCEQLKLYLQLKDDITYKDIIANPIDEPKKWKVFMQMYEEQQLENDA